MAENGFRHFFPHTRNIPQFRGQRSLPGGALVTNGHPVGFITDALQQKKCLAVPGENKGVGLPRPPHFFKLLGESADRNVDTRLAEGAFCGIYLR